MSVIFINAAFRDDSRTNKLAQHYMSRFDKDVKTIDLGTNPVKPLDKELLKIYNKAVAEHDFSNRLFEPAIDFANATEIVIAAPFWNFGLPGVLSNYLEIICSQGVTFDIDDAGTYYSCCKAKKLTFITTAGGRIPANNHAFGFIKDLAEMFWKIPEVKCYKADGLDIYGTDVDRELKEVCDQMDFQEV